MVEGHQSVAAQLREWTMASRPLGNPPAGDPQAADLARGGPNEEKLTGWAIKALPIVEKHSSGRAPFKKENRTAIGSVAPAAARLERSRARRLSTRAGARWG